jgi:hypothetical protein
MAKKEATVSLIDTFSEFKDLKNIDRTTMVSVLKLSYQEYRLNHKHKVAFLHKEETEFSTLHCFPPIQVR